MSDISAFKGVYFERRTFELLRYNTAEIIKAAGNRVTPNDLQEVGVSDGQYMPFHVISD